MAEREERKKRLNQSDKYAAKARESLLAFIKYFQGDDYIVNWHHEAICDRLSQLKDQIGQKIMIFVGPQRGKSEIVSRYFPAWWLGHFPGSKNILSSYSGDLADSFNRDCQAIVSDSRYKEIFPDTGTGYDSTYSHLKKTQSLFETSARGYLFSVGVGGSTTGRSAGNMGATHGNLAKNKGLFICDDPIKDPESAFSKSMKEKRDDWWRAVVTTRVHRTSHQILMHTRWATDDVAGRLIDEGAIDRGWEIISFPELGPDPDYDNPYDPRKEDDEPLWPDEKGDYDELQELIKDVGEYFWAAMYQQKPTIKGGAIIKTDWLKFYHELPIALKDIKPSQLIQSWDMQFKETGSSYTCGVTLLNIGADYYLVDFYHQKADIIDSERAVLAMYGRWPKTFQVLIEDKANGPAVISLLKKKVSGLKAVQPEAKKDERLMVVAPMFEAGNVHLPLNHPKLKVIVNELTGFPQTPNDDIVDAISQGLYHFKKTSGLRALAAYR